MDSLLVFVSAFFEVIPIYFLIVALDEDNKLRIWQTVVFLTGISLVTTVIDYLQLPFHLFFIMVFMLLLFKIWTSQKSINIISDIIAACVVFFAFQLLTMILLQPALGDITQNQILLLGIMVVAGVLAMLAGKSSRIDRFLEHYYRHNRNVIVLVMMSMAVLAVLVAQIWDDKNTLFWNQSMELIVLTALYFLMNIALIFAVYQNVKKKTQLRIHKEHEEYLKRLTDELARREHEYKNHLNAIIGIATHGKEEPLREIIKYSNDLLEKEQEKEKTAVITDNSIASSFIAHELEKAKEKNIKLEYFIERPFPKYRISDFDMIEILANLMNNAFEAVSDYEREQRNVFLSIKPHQIIVVNHIAEDIKEETLFKIGDKGYSSKGEGRGYGVGNVMRLCRKYDINVSTWIEDNNFVFELNFQKEPKN